MSITSDLTQALQCAGKCDCCQKLQNQINALEAKFNDYIPTSQKSGIIDAAFGRSRDYTTSVKSDLLGFIGEQGIEIDDVKRLAEGGMSIAKTAFGALDDINKWRNERLREIINYNSSPKNYDADISRLDSRINSMNSYLSQQVSEIFNRISELNRLAREGIQDLARATDNRFGAVESRLNRHDIDIMGLGKLLSSLQSELDNVTKSALAAMLRLQARIDAVEPVARQALDFAGTANNKAIDAKFKADRAYNLADSAKFKADEALGRADAAYQEATEAKGQANNANNKASDAVKKADSAINDVSAIKPKISDIETRLTDTNRRIDGIDSEVSGIKGRIDSVEGKIPAQISTQVATQVPPVVTAVFENYAPPKIEEKVRSIFDTNPKSFTQTDFIPKVNQNTNDINDIRRRLGDAENMNAEGNRKLQQILDKIPSFTPVPASTTAAATINSFLTDPRISGKLKDAAAAGTCETMNPGGCGDNAMKRNNADLLNKLGGGLDAAAQAAQVALLTKIDGKLGAEIVGGLSGWMTRFSKWSVTGQAMQYLTFAVTLHNAIQLSSNIGTTLIQVIQNVVDLIGLKDSDDNPFNVQEIIGKSINSFIELAIGKENIANFKSEWAKYSRIYQAGGNLFSSLMSMGDTMVNAVQIVSGQNAKIGNALKVWGVVGEKAYGWMNITPNFSNPLLTKLQSLEETASTVEQVSQEPLNVKSAKEQLETSSKELFDSLEQKDEKKQGKELPEANKVKEAMDKAKQESTGVDKILADAYEDDDE